MLTNTASDIFKKSFKEKGFFRL